MPQITNIIIRNCNNIGNASIAIADNKLNIKYGTNGTGKSTIVRAIELAIGQVELNDLLPFKYRQDTSEENQPVVENANAFNSVKVFNESYVNQFLFTQDEVIKNSFEIFIKTPAYEEKMAEIDALVSRIKDTFENDQKLEQVINDLGQLSESFGKSTSGIHGSSKIAKAVLHGNPIENIPTKLASYESFLTMPDNKNVEWIGWHNKGEDYLDISENCPYCTSPSEEKKETIRSIKKEYNPNNIKHLNEIIQIMDRLGDYFAPETKDKLNEILKNNGDVTDEQKTYLQSIRPNIETLKSKLTSLKYISFFSFKESDKAQEKINELKIDLSFLPHLKSEEAEAIVTKVNEALAHVETQIGKLQGQIAQQKQGIEKTIKSHISEINSFLKYAGYTYHIDITEEQNTYKMMLCHSEFDNHIQHSSRHLSYGERNAFAIVLFMYQCLSEKPDLIILDDPISSFDKNKKYAITSKLFRGKDSFHGKTVLMATHDFEPIIDIVHTFHSDFCEFSSASFLENVSGTINEIPITKQDIQSFGEICNDNIAGNDDDIIKSIYLRRYFEILDQQGDEYNVLSSLLKKRPIPTSDAKGELPLQEEVIAQATTKIRGKIPTFNYDSLVIRLNDKEVMLQVYTNSSNNYEKLQLYRIIMQGSTQKDLHENDVVRKFINEAFHIENEYVAQLDPTKFSPVPQYIIDECDKVLEE